uniref:Uncharacterized protein n=1 Tax=Rhizophora mucronata TaxID=61149 RepID=A0A2P2P8V5_RHIMU
MFLLEYKRTFSSVHTKTKFPPISSSIASKSRVCSQCINNHKSFSI